MNDHYRTLAARAEFRQKIERSEFLGIAFPVTSEDAFFAELAAAQKRDFDATHHCWAFRLFHDARTRSSDAGEPSGTAGKPILAAIEGAALYDAGVIVVRWYGGIKLGTGGLARAYRETAAETLRGAQLADRYVYARVRVIVPFDALSVVYRLVEPPHVVLAEERYGDENEFLFDVRASRVNAFAAQLTERRLRFILP
ncbi:MAG: YigZ family protein [Acidobacteria bacterium]|nr:YigZ family protein [Acidobacteriota bacterium]MBV9477446.1 YigZ family protein [Acidobacteriota bacterium]